MAHGGARRESTVKTTQREATQQQATSANPAGSTGEHIAPPPQTSQELIKYVLVELDVLRENHQEFRKQMHTLTEIMFDYKGWELVYAAYPITGVLNRFIHIWKIPDESDILEVMREGALNDNPTKPGTFEDLELLEDQFRWCYQRVQGMIERTTHTVMTSLPYDPEHVGYQSQTILVDADEEKFVIDHRDLRAEFSDRDISDELEELRQARKRSFSRGGRAGVHAKRASSERKHQTVTEQTLPRLQEHLNRGTIVAEIDMGQNKGKALLFNLAGLKPRSVFQQIDSAADDAPSPETKLNSRANGATDLPVQALLIAAPWGAVYELGSGDLQNRRVVKPIAAAHKDKVDAALAPLLEAKAPIAAIPEERDQTIGDGCACYIINLSSFVAAK